MDSFENVTKNVQEIVELSKALENETVEGLLGKPAWRDEALPEAVFVSVEHLEGALAGWERVIQQHHVEHDFNMFGDYVQFYQDYCDDDNTKKNNNPLDFYRDYEAKINPKHMNCTGLALNLLISLQQSDREFGPYFGLVSSEEGIQAEAKSASPYELESANVVKRHVLICLKFFMPFTMACRKGCVLIDSGYSLTRPIVVMRDSAYPHTGWFVAWCSETIEQRNYKFVNDGFIQYELGNMNHTTGEMKREPLINLISIKRVYLSYESVTQKRSLLTNTKFWVVRNGQGPIAAFYSLIDKRNLIILYPQNQLSTVVKHEFSIDQLDSVEVRKALRKVAECSARSRAPNDDQSSDEATKIEFNFQMYFRTLREYRKTLDDERFTLAIRAMDEWILSKQQKVEFI